MSKTKSNIVAIKMPAMKYSQFLSQKNESRQDREQRRLDFPIRDDSRFISGVGKKHFN